MIRVGHKAEGVELIADDDLSKHESSPVEGQAGELESVYIVEVFVGILALHSRYGDADFDEVGLPFTPSAPTAVRVPVMGVTIM